MGKGKRWQSVWIAEPEKIDIFKAFLRGMGVEWEPSGCGNGVEFSVEADEDEESRINRFLEEDLYADEDYKTSAI